MTQTTEQRQAIEAEIMMLVIADLLEAGMTLSVNDGESITVKNSRDAVAIFNALRTTDEDSLVAMKDGVRMGAVVVSAAPRGMTNEEWEEYCAYVKGLSPEDARERLAERFPPRLTEFGKLLVVPEPQAQTSYYVTLPDGERTHFDEEGNPLDVNSSYEMAENLNARLDEDDVRIVQSGRGEPTKKFRHVAMCAQIVETEIS